MPAPRTFTRLIEFPDGSHRFVEFEDFTDPDPPPPTAWTPETIGRFLRLAQAHAEGRFHQQWETEFPTND